MPDLLLCPNCQAKLELASAPPVGAVARCPRCNGVVPVAPGPTDERTHTFAGPEATGDAAPPTPETVTYQTEPGAPRPPARSEIDFLAPPEQPDEIGRLGPYRVLGRLGSGGMGMVFRAEEPQLKRMVALKVMLPRYASNPAAKARFLREAHAQAAVEHEHVVAIFQAGEQNGVAYIAMPLLKGQTLGAALKQNPNPPLKEVLRIGREMAEGLAAAHDVGLIHRDIKPANVWLDGRRRRVKILDFGLARAVGAYEPSGDTEELTHPDTEVLSDGPITVQGAVIGTPLYMSPEQSRGEAVDHRTDLFSLGVVLSQMTTGALPFTGPTTTVEGHSPPAPAVQNPAVPVPLSDLIMRLLAKPVADRPVAAEDVAEELRALESVYGSTTELVATPVSGANDPWVTIGDEPGTQSGTEPGPPTSRAVRKQSGLWQWAAVGAAIGLALVGVGAVALKFGRPPTPEPEPEPSTVTKAPTPKNPKPKEPEKVKEPEPENQPAPPPMPGAPGFGVQNLATLVPVRNYDFRAGRPFNGTAPGAGPGGRIEWGYTKNTMFFKAPGGARWFQSYGPTPPNAGVEIRGRVKSEAGSWAFDPVGGCLIHVDHIGVLTIDFGAEAKDKRVVRHEAIKKQGEWNTVTVLIRNDLMDFYVNGEEVATEVPVPGRKDKNLTVGIEGRIESKKTKADVEVEYERITVWNLNAPLKK